MPNASNEQSSDDTGEEFATVFDIVPSVRSHVSHAYPFAVDDEYARVVDDLEWGFL